MKVSTEIDNNFGYKKITHLVDNIPLINYVMLCYVMLCYTTSMRTRLEHAHCLETINNMWFLGKREIVNAWKKADFDGFREKDE
jgi:hypothetical protein